MEKKQKMDMKVFLLEFAVSILLVLFLLSLLIPTVHHYLIKEEAALVLREAKTVNLAAKTISYEFAAKGKKVTSEEETQTGINEEAQAMIEELSGGDGTIEYLKFDEKEEEVIRLKYRNGDLYVTYKKNNDQSVGDWHVYQMNTLIDEK